MDLVLQERPTVLGMITGVVAGLVAITPASGYVGLTGTVCVGALAAATCYVAVVWLKRVFGYDDTLDAFGVHGVGGMIGSLLTGVFALKSVNAAGADGLFAGGQGLLAVQASATLVAAAYSFGASWLLLKLTDLTVGLRVTNEEERIGLDLTQHSEAGYTALE
jgi:Amt family ammonium transporter